MKDDTGKVACMEVMKIHAIFQSGTTKDRGHLQDICVAGNTVLKWVFRVSVRGPGIRIGSSG